MLTKKRQNKKYNVFVETHKHLNIKELCLYYFIPYEYVLCHPTEEERIKFIMKVIMYRETKETKNKKVIEANEYYVKYKML
jgi:hypothetical protein